MRNKDEFKALVEERAAAQRRSAVLLAQRRKIAIRSATVLVLGLIILPVGAKLLGVPFPNGLSNSLANDQAFAPEDGNTPPMLGAPSEENAPGDSMHDTVPTPEVGDPDPSDPTPPGFTEKPTDIPGVPEMLGFSSFDEIERFVIAANGSADAYAKFVQELEHSFTASQAVAQTIAKQFTSAELPVLNGQQTADDFGCTYYGDRSELDLIYRINGIRYRFVYCYQPPEPHTYDGKPILTDLPIGSTSLDLYQGEKCLVGSYESGTTAVRVIVYTEQVSNVDFSLFVFQSIADQ